MRGEPPTGQRAPEPAADRRLTVSNTGLILVTMPSQSDPLGRVDV